MSTIRVPITRITEMRAHSDPEIIKLEVAVVKGWQLCVPIGRYKVGDRVAYFERGTVIPLELAERLDILTYLSDKLDIHGERVLVVHEVKLRGEPSFGLAIDVPAEFSDADDDTDLKEYFGASKYFPPARVGPEDAADDHPLFPQYTDIEDLRDFPHVFNAGSHVVVSEKLHGTNCRVGFVVNEDETVELMAGGRTLRRKNPAADIDTLDRQIEAYRGNTYWYPYSIDAVRALMKYLADSGAMQAVLFGEMFGPRIAYDYGLKAFNFRAFDLMIDSQYVGYREFIAYMDNFGIERVPVLFTGFFDLEKIKEHSNGPTKIGQAKHGREGVVIRPYFTEGRDPQIGRPVLKYVGSDFTFSKKRGADTTDV